MSPRVSVLIPTWNRARYLGEAIESVLNQTYPDFEIVVVDDGSSDGTSELIKRYEHIRYIWQPHKGISVTRNRALAEASGDLIAWLDSDDLYIPTKLEKQVAYLDAYPTCQLVFCLPTGISSISQKEMTHSQKNLMNVYNSKYKRHFPTACIRRELFDRYGLFDPSYKRGEDTEWLNRIYVSGINIGHCLMERLYMARIHDKQISFDKDDLQKSYLQIYADSIRNAKRKGTLSCQAPTKHKR